MLGARQAELLGARLRAVRFDRIFSSQLMRAVQTAAAAARFQTAAVEVVPALAECGETEFEASAQALLAACGNVIIRGLRAQPFADDDARAAYCLETLVYPFAGADDLRILIVGHGTFNARLIGGLMGFGYDPDRIVSQNNACVSRFQVFTENGARRVRVRSLNDVSHLPEEMRT